MCLSPPLPLLCATSPEPSACKPSTQAWSIHASHHYTTLCDVLFPLLLGQGYPPTVLGYYAISYGCRPRPAETHSNDTLPTGRTANHCERLPPLVAHPCKGPDAAIEEIIISGGAMHCSPRQATHSVCCGRCALSQWAGCPREEEHSNYNAPTGEAAPCCG